MDNDKPMLSIKLDSPFPTLNEYIDKERANRVAAARIKRNYTHLAKILTRNKGTVSQKVDLLFEWHVATSHDHDNIAFGKKFILDGMKLAGVIKDDRQKFIGHLYDEFYKDKLSYVVVHFLEHKKGGRWNIGI